MKESQILPRLSFSEEDIIGFVEFFVKSYKKNYLASIPGEYWESET